ncbi:MAG: hypothetical protein ACREJ4_16905 [Candidatus Methylomirabilaceae bacterium]
MNTDRHANARVLWKGRHGKWRAAWRALSAKDRKRIARAVRRGEVIEDSGLAEIAVGFMQWGLLSALLFGSAIFAIDAIINRDQTWRRWIVDIAMLLILWMLTLAADRRLNRGRRANFDYLLSVAKRGSRDDDVRD